MAQSATNLIQLLKENGLKEQLRALYGEEQLEGQTRRYLGILENYVKEFGDEEVEIYSAPGRSEVGGNHTDHQRGQVLAAAVDLDVVAVAHKTDDGNVEQPRPHL